jgi:hypothetical protein
VSEPSQHRLLYAICFLVAVISSYAISQLGLIATCTNVVLVLAGVLAWKNKRPRDFILTSDWPRVFIGLMWAFVFFAGYLIVRKVQPMNYRAHNLAALAIFSALLAICFGSIGRKNLSR